VTEIDRSTVERVRRREYGDTLRIERDGRIQIDTRRVFETSSFPESLPMGARTVYREDRPTDSVQIRVYDDRVTLQLDRYNPKYTTRSSTPSPTPRSTQCSRERPSPAPFSAGSWARHRTTESVTRPP
jgi:hypothetical protein